jgi:hypothetical protein
MASSPSRASGGYTSYPSPAKSVPSQFSPSMTIREAQVPNTPHPLLLPLKPTSHLPFIFNFVLQGGYAKGVVYDSVHGFSGSNPSVVVLPRATSKRPPFNYSLLYLQHYGVVDPSIAIPNIHKPQEQWKDALGEQSYHAWKK